MQPKRKQEVMSFECFCRFSKGSKEGFGPANENIRNGSGLKDTENTNA